MGRFRADDLGFWAGLGAEDLRLRASGWGLFGSGRQTVKTLHREGHGMRG